MKYYEVIGQSRKAILRVLERRVEKIDAAVAWSRRYGALGTMEHSLLGSTIVVGVRFKEGVEPDPGLWRKHYNRQRKQYDDWYVPTKKTKEGKALYEEMRQLRMPGGSDIADAVGLDCFYGGLNFSVPGCRVWGKRQRVFLVVSDYVEPPKKRDCKRISDLDFERLEASYVPKKKRTEAAKKK